MNLSKMLDEYSNLRKTIIGLVRKLNSGKDKIIHIDSGKDKIIHNVFHDRWFEGDMAYEPTDIYDFRNEHWTLDCDDDELIFFDRQSGTEYYCIIYNLIEYDDDYTIIIGRWDRDKNGIEEQLTKYSIFIFDNDRELKSFHELVDYMAPFFDEPEPALP